jgi:A/G-specific adenine glycosylase
MYGNPNTRSKHHVKQSTFKGSDRQIRGALVRLLGEGAKTRTALLLALKEFSDIRVDAQLHALKKEGLISYQGRQFFLAN